MTTRDGIGDNNRAGRKLDRQLAQAQADALADQLEEEGRELAGVVIRTLAKFTRDMAEALQDAEEELSELKVSTKTSRGRDRASAGGTIQGKGVSAADEDSAPSNTVSITTHRHTYGADGVCGRWVEETGGICGARRQRNRATRTLDATETNGASDAEVTP
jgi:hypothetical protein